MKLLSSAFENGQFIPKIYTCQGKNINPPLSISDVPKQAHSLVLIMEDPDVPKYVRKDGMYDHWIIFNMKSDTKEIKENSVPKALFGKNTEGNLKYIGPCPPDREHRYFFKLFALDCLLDLPEGVSKAEIENAMKGHILEQVELIGLYEKD